ncbi:dihydroneopterin aldolase [Candidatus Nitrotoga sp. 1052]|uniref:dihydroneopterin aldolase n=1 Tax=Candidatus Nitrotoga sp. 1052 TaxID=2886964 RepID=UPI001EF6CFCA|nr:dihydroneopterin aldolase [Candidatus Nitrotoga sp. 1052]CAH1082961.1 hypothetical protein NTG1052_440032 [Candidatus Nitrotoga sp. 1052]
MAHTLAHDGITLYTVIGVYEWERAASRPLVFDLRLESVHLLGMHRAVVRALDAINLYKTDKDKTSWQLQRKRHQASTSVRGSKL